MTQLVKHFKKQEVAFVLILLLALSPARSNTQEVNVKPCNTNSHRAFDFWLGDWLVTTSKQKTKPAVSSITLSNNGCSIHEKYSTAGGYSGNSINFYDQKTDKWHQTWIDNQGNPLFLSGGFKNNLMILTDDVNRITWRTLENEQINQTWETTADGGKTWTKIFNGYYTKK